MPLGSSSEAPVTRPGPSRERNAFNEKLKPACGGVAHGCWASVSGDGTGTARDGSLVPFGDICAELKLMFGCARCGVPLAFLLVLGRRKNRIRKMLGCKNKKTRKAESPFAAVCKRNGGLSGLKFLSRERRFLARLITRGYPARFIGLSVF